MVTLEYELPDSGEAEAFNAALYSFLDRSIAAGMVGDDVQASWHSTPLGKTILKTVNFGCPERAAAFEAFWNSYEPVRRTGRA